MVNGGVAAMEVLACCLFDPGDVLLTPSPCYARIFVNFSERFGIHVVDVLLRDNNKVCPGFWKHLQYSGWSGAHSRTFSVAYLRNVMIITLS